MSEEEWEEWMASTFYSENQVLPKTGGMAGSLLVLLIGAGLLGYGGFLTFGRGAKKFISVVEPDRVSVLRPTGKTGLTLITCTPIYTAIHRLIVKAELIKF